MHRNPQIDTYQQQAQALIEQSLTIPQGYQYKSCMLVNHDALPVFIFRYEKSDGTNNGLGGEHFSVSVDLQATKIMGFMHIASEHCGPGLPDEESAKATARETLSRCAPDLEGRYEIKWVMPLKEKPEKIPHESPFPFSDADGREHLVTGVRVKLFFPDLSSWGWVIVGRNGSVIAFEREVLWNDILGRRSTPAWLHDPYVIELNADIDAVILAA
ncbi:MAG: hypothetical protein R3183_07215 [Oleiphilaceae bacterium]|nr:hypothetical protein [Oleiphilaceae bacterium]